MNLEASNRDAYAGANVVEHYARGTELFAAEAELLRDLAPLSVADVLDIGIGGGRTTQVIAPQARTYIGIDYIPAMVAAANEATEHKWDLRIGDACDLSDFADGQFDLVIFSFNGISELPTTQARQGCMSEARRVLRPGGHFMFSVCNPTFLKIPAERSAGVRVRFRSILGYAQHVHRLGEAVFWRGHGWRTFVSIGGKRLRQYNATPRSIHQELTSVGFRVERTLNGLHPRALGPIHTPWWYYMAVRA